MIERQRELQLLIKGCQNKPRQQSIELIASYSHETRRVPDPYSFDITQDGELYSNEGKCLVKSVVRRDTFIGEIEYQALCDIESWANHRSSGVIVWISPPDETYYPDGSKIIVSEIEQNGNNKTLYNRAILLDFNKQDCLKLAQNLGSSRLKFSSAEDVRRHPIPLETKRLHWSYILGEFIDKEVVWQMVRSGEDKKIKQQTLARVDSIYDELFKESAVNRLLVMGLVGTYSTSCPSTVKSFTALSYFFEHSLKYFDCPNPKCNKKIESGKGITTCPYCGARKEDYNRCA